MHAYVGVRHIELRVWAHTCAIPPMLPKLLARDGEKISISITALERHFLLIGRHAIVVSDKEPNNKDKSW